MDDDDAIAAAYERRLSERSAGSPDRPKQCFYCREWCPARQFDRDRARRDGRKPRCDSCRRADRERALQDIGFPWTEAS